MAEDIGSPYAEDRKVAQALARAREHEEASMKIYVATNYTGPGWANEWFAHERDAVEAAVSWEGMGQETKVHQLTFRNDSAGIAALLNAAGDNPVNFGEVEGLVGLREVRRTRRR